jgi:hypothetical protein
LIEAFFERVRKRQTVVGVIGTERVAKAFLRARYTLSLGLVNGFCAIGIDRV